MGKLSLPLNNRWGTTTRGVPVVNAMTAMLAAMRT
jgi:hypothetical protein